MKSFPLVSLVLSTFLSVSCANLDDIQITGVSGFDFRGMENSVANFSADVGVSNPSSVNFKISEVNLKTIVEGNYLGTLTTSDRVKIRARSDSSYHMNFSLTMANMLSGASSLYALTRRKQVRVEMQGFVKTRTWFLTKKVEVNESQTIDVPAFGR
jgi:LEA14-like dessication related protein